MKKMFGIVLGCVLAFGQAQAQAEFGQFGQKVDGLAITFYPVAVRAQELVAMELITSDQYQDRYIALEQSVMQNDWRPILSTGNNLSNPGKCTVIVRQSRYDVDCWLVLESGASVRYASVQTVKEVIAVVKGFSRNRLER